MLTTAADGAKEMNVYQPDTTFEVASERVAAKAFDDEVILINLLSGLYYSMDGVGSLIWALVESGHSFDDTVRQICDRYDVPTDTASVDLDALLERLLTEELIAVSAESRTPSDPPSRPAEQQTYKAPTLNRYDDMAALMALDPPMPGFMDSTWNESGD